MTVTIEYGLDDDKRPDLNADRDKARFYVSQIVRINFIDDVTGKVMFSFVPKCEDEQTFVSAFSLLNTYDQMRMSLFHYIKENELTR